jgi:hypothetical protein
MDPRKIILIVIIRQTSFKIIDRLATLIRLLHTIDNFYQVTTVYLICQNMSGSVWGGGVLVPNDTWGSGVKIGQKNSPNI